MNTEIKHNKTTQSYSPEVIKKFIDTQNKELLLKTKKKHRYIIMVLETKNIQPQQSRENELDIEGVLHV